MPIATSPPPGSSQRTAGPVATRRPAPASSDGPVVEDPVWWRFLAGAEVCPASLAGMPRRARLALSGASIGVLLLVVLWYVAFHVGAVRQADAAILNGFLGLEGPRVDRVANFVATLCSPKRYVVLAALPVLVALLRGRPRVAVTIALIVLCANETTELLKPLLAAHRDPT